VLVAITDNGSALFFSVPFLERITRMDLYFGTAGYVLCCRWGVTGKLMVLQEEDWTDITG
jgi:hypothetical protein